jgi:hypothetical protein
MTARAEWPSGIGAACGVAPCGCYDGEARIDASVVVAELLAGFAGEAPPGAPTWRVAGGGAADSATAAQIAAAMLRAACARKVSADLADNRAALERRIAQDMQQAQPIRARMLWSPRKHWIDARDSLVDLAELVALATLRGVADAVRARYPPGMMFELVVEDLEFEFIEGADPGAALARDRYVASLRHLLRLVDAGRLFSLAASSGRAADAAELAGWRAQLAANARAIADYWEDSERAGMERAAGLASYARLRELGWVGTLPMQMRDHYLDRLRAATLADDAQRRAMVVRNLAGILLNRQVRLAAAHAHEEPIKFSFVPPARGAPHEILAGRVDLRFAPRALASRVSAAGPWSTKGYLRHRGARVALGIAGWHAVRADATRFAPGALQVRRGGDQAEVRADYRIDSER